MNIPREINVEEIDLIYIVSNTPAYLFKRMRGSESVLWMASNLSTEKLVQLYTYLRSEEGNNNYPVSLSYATLIALSTKELSLATDTLKRLPLIGLDWGKQILSIANSQAVPTLTTDLKFTPPRQRSLIFGGSTSENTLTIPSSVRLKL